MEGNNAAVVKHVVTGSIAEEAGVEAGDTIKLINGEVVRDVFDYRYLVTNEEIVLEIEKKDGELWEIDIEKDEYEDLGIEFENSMLDDVKSCTNKCVFCFIDQLPKGMRETLYFKDDDSRLSFLTGNYVTLTNINNDDIDRIIAYKMSPINVSVHTTNPELRVTMLNNKFAGNVLEKIRKLSDGGITVNCQIVLCRGMNDGRELDKTLTDLTALYPGVSSISVVPVGITCYREGLRELKPYDTKASQEVVGQIRSWQAEMLDKFGSRIVYTADEFYIMAQEELPDYEEYEGFPQLENGVGLIALLRHEFFEHLPKTVCTGKGRRVVSIATGVSAYKYIWELARELEKVCGGPEIKVFEIKNSFFGENVTVTGLLTGQDLLAQLKDKDLGEELLICTSMLKSGERIFLDDYTVEMLEEALGIKVTVVENSGQDFIKKIIRRWR